MIGAAVALQVLGLVLLLALFTIAWVASRRMAAALRAHIARLEARLEELETRSSADSTALTELRDRLASAPALPSVSAAVAPAAQPASILPAELVALLTAAAYAAIGKPVVLHYALVIGEDQGGAWRTAGRHDIFASHRIR